VSAYDIHAWVEFGVAVAGAAAVLTGLVFVAVSINLERVLAVPGVPDRAGESVLMFLAVLIYSLVLLVPGQSTTALGVELLVSGLVFAAVLVLVFRRPTFQPLSWKITRLVAALGSSLPAVVAGVSLMAEAGGGILLAVRGDRACLSRRDWERVGAARRGRPRRAVSAGSDTDGT
jgi:hypothetical protein